MRIAVCADIHFDEQPALSRGQDGGYSSRLTDTINAVRWFGTAAGAAGCSVAYILGDLFDDRASLTLPVLDAAAYALRLLRREIKGDVFALVGNHDAYMRDASVTSLSAMRGCVRVIDKPTSGLPGDVAAVPWFDDRASFAEAVKGVRGRYLFAHVKVEGAAPGPGVPLDVLDNARFCRVLLGDVHEPVELSKRVSYVGALLQHGFEDADGWRGFVVLDSETGKIERIHNANSPRFYVWRSGPQPKVRACDYLRVLRKDAPVVDAPGAYVEIPAPPPPDALPRIDLADAKTDEDILTAYVRHVSAGLDDAAVQRRVAVGTRLLHEAKNTIQY